MNKKIILIVSIVFLFLTVISYANEEPTQREWNIYYDFAEKSAYINSQDKGGVSAAYGKIADEHGINTDELMDIIEKVEVYGLKPQEYKIVEELGNKLTALGQNATKAQKDAVYQEVARKYGLSVARVIDLTVRAMAWITY